MHPPVAQSLTPIPCAQLCVGATQPQSSPVHPSSQEHFPLHRHLPLLEQLLGHSVEQSHRAPFHPGLQIHSPVSQSCLPMPLSQVSLGVRHAQSFEPVHPGLHLHVPS